MKCDLVRVVVCLFCWLVAAACRDRPQPAPPPSPGPAAPTAWARQISLGAGAACARLDDGSVRCWGTSLGSGSPWETPTPIPAFAGAERVSMVGGAACAQFRDRRWVCIEGSGKPARLGVDPQGATQVAAKDGSGCVVTDSGGLRCGGDPVATGLGPVSQLVMGYHSACALLADQTVRCWGSNLYGNLGNGSREDSWVPVRVSGLTGATQIALTNQHACAVMAQGTVRCWGSNEHGQLGDGTTVVRLRPVAVRGLAHVSHVAVGDDFTCALLEDGTVRCWGSGRYGTLGDGTVREASLIPVAVAGLTDVAELAAVSGYACARRRTGDVWCWGGNAAATLGDGTRASRARPVRVRFGPSDGPASTEPDLDLPSWPQNPNVPCESYPSNPPPGLECIRYVLTAEKFPWANDEGYVFGMCGSGNPGLPPAVGQWEIRCRIRNLPPLR